MNTYFTFTRETPSATMKSLLFTFLMLLANAAAGLSQQDAILKYFSKYIDDPTFSAVYISPKMFDMVARIEIEDMDPEVQEVIRSMKGLRILQTETKAMQRYNEALQCINPQEYEPLMTARDGGENIRFMVREKGNLVEELLMMVGGADNFALLSFIGNIDLKKIGKLAKALDIENLERLETLNKH